MTIQRPSTDVHPDSDSEREVARTRTGWSVPKVLAGLLAMLFFAGPGIARVLGEQPETIENRALAPFPSVHDEWDFFPKLTAWATDHLPLRDRAVRVNNEVSQRVFAEMPATAGKLPSVILGRDGWLYYSGDIVNGCAAKDRMAQVSDGVRRLAGIVAKTSGAYVMTVAPNKSSIESERLPDRYPLDTCAATVRDTLRQQLATTPPPGYLDLFGPITEVKRQHGMAYLPQDTHWTEFGRIQYATEVARRLDPALLDATTVTPTGPRSSDGDLNAIRGIPGPTIADGATLTRSGVTTRTSTMSLTGVTHFVATSTSTNAPIWPGRTVVIGDSFSEHSAPELAPFFSELVIAFPTNQKIPARAMADLLLSADTVIFEQVERNYVSDDQYPTTQSYLDEVQRFVDQDRSRQNTG